ncbi:MAG: hypothetical protein A2005_09885 [Desulfuromonadales bacterium GWC2_61_20]|nr:MAG: hypothetical protein A2005_09885 [Desulfuromonadales bacterium GWC2_61_20]HAD04115.1 hypothetical protein [Desulfuromonas sp.]HBT83263.1 hypothetical protein [Desulfuromonas sp.]
MNPAGREHNPLPLSWLHRLPWFSRRHQTSILVRLMSLAFIWAVTIFALASAGLWWTTEQVIKDSTRRQAIQWLNKFDDLATPLFVSSNPDLFEDIRKQAVIFPEIAFLRLVAPDGHTELGRYVQSAFKARTSLLTPFSAEELEQLTEVQGAEKPRLEKEIGNIGVLRVAAPAVIKSISRDGLIAFALDKEQKENVKIIGFVDIGLDFHSYRDSLGRHILLGCLLILGFFIVATLIGRVVIQRALRPLADLQIPLAKLAQGETDIHVDSHGASEIAAIGEALNTTIAAINARDRELHRLATYDTLTGLLNRHSFNRELEREKARVILEEHTSALLFIDLDKFKEVNDTVGHTAGDELLFQIGHLLSGKVRTNDILARLGGDEFTIILRNVNIEQASTIASQIGAAMRDFVFAAEGHTFSVHCSIGVTIIDGSSFTPTELLTQADTACHEAKNHGRDCFKLYRDIASEEILALAGSGLREQIERALDEHNFALNFFPIKDCTSGHISAFETFVRMSSGNREIPARAFFAAAERFDLAPRIDRWVIAEALRQLAACTNPAIVLSINLSGRTLQQVDIIDFIAGCLKEQGLDPARISFEIPERTVLDSVTQTKNFMEKVKELGCGVVIDDFGISLNSLNLLRYLPVAQLKIEASLISNAASSPFDRAVIVSIVSIARELNIITVAKGVMRNEDELLLCSLGVQMIQKHELAPPLSRLPNLGD